MATFHSTVGVNTVGPTMDIDLVRYIRITNLDSSNPVVLNLGVDIGDGTDGDDGVATIGISMEVEAGKSFIMGSPHSSIIADDDSLGRVTSSVALMDLRSIHIDPVSEAVQVEAFIASA